MYSRHRQLSSMPSPTSKLPVELLSYIFNLCTHAAVEHSSTDEEEYSPPMIDTQSIRVPLILSSVCRHWRRVALGTPSLWTSICITPELFQQYWDGSSWVRRLNTTHITSYLARSRNYPLNILIDARDENWDFSEPEITPEEGSDAYTPLFSSRHMEYVASLLIPHILRWRSLSILTDTWAPMHAALTTINPFITRYGAPMLESLTLMRCNDFISYSPEFQPSQMKKPAFLKQGSAPSAEGLPANILPRLKYLTLRGVHVDWQSLVSALEVTESGLMYLDLGSHCADVRPTLDVFQQLLQSCSGLRRLSVVGSGPDVDSVNHDYKAVLLSHLKNITVGYRDVIEGQTILELLNAPNAKVFTLEDSTYPNDPEEVDAGTLLNYIGTQETHLPTTTPVACELPHGLHYQFAVDTNAASATSPQPESASPSPPSEKSRAAFPLLESVTLKDVKASPRPLRAFFSALPNLQHLELTGMTMHAVNALLPGPSRQPAISLASCPCPQLQSLCIKGFEQLKGQDLDFIVGGLTVERQNKGACGLKEVDIHVNAASAACVGAMTSPGTKVNIISDDEDSMADVEGYDYYMDDASMEVEAFQPGGVFNDPIFDAYYSSPTDTR